MGGAGPGGRGAAGPVPEVVLRISGEHRLPAENLIAPDSVRRLAWVPPEEITESTVAETLRGFGAREWQIGLLVADLTTALTDPPT